MAQSPRRFAELLQEGISAIAERTFKPKGVVRDELGYAIGRKGGTAIEYWAYGDGRIPKKQAEVAALARAIVKSGKLNHDWLAAFLKSAGYPDRDELVTELFPIPSNQPLHNLPAPTTPLVGRKTELAELAQLATGKDKRLITIMGPGGMGKTRLALEMALDQVNRYEHGVYFVSLAPLNAIEHIVPAIADAIGFQFQTDSRSTDEQLLDYLNQKQMFLVLDNFEHLRNGTTLVHELLQTCSQLQILVTSRERLELNSETVYILDKMGFSTWETAEGAKDSDAVQLFVQTAQRTRPNFVPKPTDLQYISRICHLVGGMPLGIILAAAWTMVLSPAEIAAELVQGFDFLESNLRDLPERQRDMRTVFAYSWQRLSEREQAAFAGLSIFRGGFTRKAAQSVTLTSLRTFTGLVNKSFLQRTHGNKYEIHELLRQFGEEQLHELPNEDTKLRDRHCAFYSLLLQHHEMRLKGPQQQEAMAEIEADIQNIRIAWQWAIARGQVARIEESLESLNRYYYWRGNVQEGETMCRLAIAQPALIDSPLGLYVSAKLRTWLAVFNRSMGNIEQCEHLLQESITILDSPKLAELDTRAVKAFVLLQTGHMASREEAVKVRTQSLDLYRALDDQWGIAAALELLGNAVQMLGDYAEAKINLLESLEIRRTLGDQNGIAFTLSALVRLALDQGHYEEAEALMQESVHIIRKTKNQAEIAFVINILGVIYQRAGKFRKSQSAHEESMKLCRDLGSYWGEAVSRVGISQVALHLGDYKRAIVYAKSRQDMAQKSNDKSGIAHALLPLAMAALAQKQYSEAQTMLEKCIVLWQDRGYQLFRGHALALAGFVALDMDNGSLAQQYLSSALDISVEYSIILPLIYTLAGFALFYIADRQYTLAIEIYASLSNNPHVANSYWFAHVVGERITDLASTLTPEAVAKATELGRKRDLWEYAAEKRLP